MSGVAGAAAANDASAAAPGPASPLRPLAVIATLTFVASFLLLVAREGPGTPLELAITFALCSGSPVALAEGHAAADGVRRKVLFLLGVVCSLSVLVVSACCVVIAMGGGA